MRPRVSLGVLGYPGVSWGNQTEPLPTRFLVRTTVVHTVNCYFFRHSLLCKPKVAFLFEEKLVNKTVTVQFRI